MIEIIALLYYVYTRYYWGLDWIEEMRGTQQPNTLLFLLFATAIPVAGEALALVKWAGDTTS